jgi:peptidase M28-like protein
MTPSGNATRSAPVAASALSGGLLGAIARAPRPAGSAAEAEARRLCADRLARAGFEIAECPFSYSAFPGTWATPLAGLLLTAIAAVAAAEVGLGAVGPNSVLPWALGAFIAVAAAAWWTGRYGTRMIPVMRRAGVNLQGHRGVPSVWLVAHLDSKSQPISILARASAVVGVVSGWSGAIIAWGLSRVTPVPDWVLVGLLVVAAVSAVPIMFSWVGTGSDGALDNASGVATIIDAACRAELAFPLGVVLTSAEEYGLAGARAWVEGRPAGIAINCDGVDDRGVLTITAGGEGRTVWRSDRVRAVVGPAARLRRSLPGILMDSTAFSDRGWVACTVSLGSLASLARIHTARDTLAELSGIGVTEVAGIVAALAGVVIAEP